MQTLTIAEPLPPAAGEGFKNREDWLNRAAVLLLDYCATFGYDTSRRPYISVGFPKGGRSNTIGQCWTGERSADGQGHIFIHPGMSDGVEVLAVLLHELGHDIVGVQHGHRKPFSQWAATVGLNKPWTATTPNDALRARLVEMADALGEYPHAALDASRKAKPKRADRMRRYVCDGCGRKVGSWGDDLIAEHFTDNGSVCGMFRESVKGESDDE